MSFDVRRNEVKRRSSVLPDAARILILMLSLPAPSILRADDGAAGGKDARWRALYAEAGPSGPYLVMDDDELFGAFDLSRPGLDEVRRAVEQRRFVEAYAAWGRYWSNGKKAEWVFDPESFRRAMKERMPWLIPFVVENADKIVARELIAYTFLPKLKGRTFDWADDNNDNTFIGWQYFLWLRSLPRAYVLTGDERYARMVADIATEWYDMLPEMLVRLGARRFDEFVWHAMASPAASLGAPLRGTYLLEAYWLARRSRAFTPEVHARMLRILLGHARRVYDNDIAEYTYWNGQNSGAAWLVSAAAMLPELKEARRWRAAAVPIIRQHLEKSFRADGGHTEVSIGYHLAGLRDYWHILRLMQRNNDRELVDDRSLMEKFHKAMLWPLAVSLPDGQIPALSAGGYSTEWLIFAGLAQTFFDDASLRWAVKEFVKPGWLPLPLPGTEQILPLIFSLADESFAAALHDRRPAKPPPFTSVLLRESGYAVLRDGWGRNANVMVLDFARPSGRHGYPSKLSFVLYAKGAPMALHPGTPASYSSVAYNEWIDQTISHNTVLVNDHSPSRPFNAELEHWHDLGQVVFFGATTDVYRQTDGVIHSRFVTFLPTEYFVVFDLLNGGPGATLRWLFHCPKPLLLDSGKRVHTPPGETGVLLVPAEPEAIVEVKQGAGLSAVPVDRPYQKASRDDVPYIGYTKTIPPGRGSQTYGVVIAPFEKAVPRIEVRALPPKGNSSPAMGLVASWPGHEDWHMVSSKSELVEWRETTTDALRVFMRFPSAAAASRREETERRHLPRIVSLVGGGLLSVNGETLIQAEGVRALTLRRTSSGWAGRIETAGDAKLRILAPEASKATLDGRPARIQRHGEYVLLSLTKTVDVSIE